MLDAGQQATGLLWVVVIGAVLGPTYFANGFQAGYVVPNIVVPNIVFTLIARGWTTAFPGGKVDRSLRSAHSPGSATSGTAVGAAASRSGGRAATSG